MSPFGGAGRAGSRAMVVDLQHPGDAALFRCCYRLRAAPQLPSPESLAGSPRSSVGGGAAKGNDILVREVREVLLSYESTENTHCVEGFEPLVGICDAGCSRKSSRPLVRELRAGGATFSSLKPPAAAVSMGAGDRYMTVTRNRRPTAEDVFKTQRPRTC